MGVHQASFMNTSTCAASSQHMSSLAPPEPLCASVDWSSARLVCLSYSSGDLLVCSLSAKRQQLQALHTVVSDTGLLVWLGCSPSRLLCCSRA